jgi:hypothetical protein
MGGPGEANHAQAPRSPARSGYAKCKTKGERVHVERATRRREVCCAAIARERIQNLFGGATCAIHLGNLCCLAHPLRPRAHSYPQHILRTWNSPTMAPERRFVGALDQGTTSTRFILFDARGMPVVTAQKEHKCARREVSRGMQKGAAILRLPGGLLGGVPCSLLQAGCARSARRFAMSAARRARVLQTAFLRVLGCLAATKYSSRRRDVRCLG